jgi:pyrroloquinoline quinone (PQQ) biosynthesis protein C
MAISVRERALMPPVPNASDFLELYAFERPAPALPLEAFVEELKGMVRRHEVAPALANALRHGDASRDAMRRWIKDYWQFVRLDAQGTAASVARCKRRGLFITLSQLVNRKTGFHQVTRPPLELFLRFAAAFDLSLDELEAHYACPETMQATYTRLHFQFSSLEEGFVVSALAGEGALLDVQRDERPWLCQRGMAEYMKRAWQLDDDAVAYWRAYEDFRGFVTEPVWDIVRELAVDGSQQQLIRTTLHHWLLIYANMRRAWNEIVTGTYALPDVVWPPAGTVVQAGAEQTHEEMEEELGQFCLGLTRPTETAFGLLLSGKASLDAAKELVRDFIHLDATRNIAGQLSRQTTPRAMKAIAQAFATESGGYLTRNHMEIWADFAEQALGITREELFRWTPPTETIASSYVTSWFLVHCPAEEAIAAFHLGPPTRVKQQMGKRALGLGQGGVAGEGLIEARSVTPQGHPLAAAFERLGIQPDLADYFFRLHREIEPFEQDEGWEYVAEVVRTGPQRQAFKRAYIAKILSERRKDEGLLRRMKRLSGIDA